MKKVKHKIYETPHAVLLVEEDPKWQIPSAFFCVAFYADPIEVMKYGSNGLHFVEHVLWNMIARDCLHQTNASTFSSGPMAVYGVCLENEFRHALEHFLGGLIEAAQSKLTPELSAVTRIEQRRVSCETQIMQETSYRRKEASEKMFVFNPDMIRAKYPFDYVKKILLEECQLGKVIVMAHCKIGEDDIQLFQKLGEAFSTAWDRRAKFAPKKVLLPTYYAPPFSMLRGCPSEGGDNMTTIVYDDKINPIERLVLFAEYGYGGSPFPFAIDIDKRAMIQVTKPAKKKSRRFKYAVPWPDQYFAVPLLASYSGKLEEDWVNDLYTMSPGALERKYSKHALTKLPELLLKKTHT